MKEKEKSFTIRLPIKLVDDIDTRCEFNLRSRTKEIHALLAFAIDAIVDDHKDAIAKTAGK